MKFLAAIAIILAVPVFVLAQGTARKSTAPNTNAPTKVTGDGVKTTSGLIYWDIRVGNGEVAKEGSHVRVHYTGWLDEAGEKGKKFDSSRDRGQPFNFKLGVGQVISGWDIGVSTMQPGGQRTLVLPAEHGYGQRGAGGLIPPGATLIFDVELISFK